MLRRWFIEAERGGLSNVLQRYGYHKGVEPDLTLKRVAYDLVQSQIGPGFLLVEGKWRSSATTLTLSGSSERYC